MTHSAYLFEEDERARIGAAEDLLDDGTIRLLKRVGVTDGWRCAEIGAGGGSIARWLSQCVGPRGRVVATDLDIRHLEFIGTPNVEVRLHDIVRQTLAPAAGSDAGFDLVHTRLVLGHLPERESVLDKLVKAVRPGGWLFVEDVDYISGVSISEFGAREHERTQGVRLQEFMHSGMDHNVGRRLPAMLRSAGLEDVQNEGRVWVMEGGSAGARWFKLSLAHLRGRLVCPGKLTDAEVDGMLQLFDDPKWSAYSPIIVAAWGRRP